ncbi:hypothetical protein GN956_G24734 [Arapaima gigas]
MWFGGQRPRYSVQHLYRPSAAGRFASVQGSRYRMQLACTRCYRSSRASDAARTSRGGPHRGPGRNGIQTQLNP